MYSSVKLALSNAQNGVLKMLKIHLCKDQNDNVSLVLNTVRSDHGLHCNKCLPAGTVYLDFRFLESG
jgi:hypothetical protein